MKTMKTKLKGILATGITAMLIVCCGILVACKKGSSTPDPVKPPVVAGVKFDASADIFPNPERGFTKTFTIRTALSPAALNTYRTNQNTTLIVRLFYLEDYKDKALDQAKLDFIQTDLNTIRNAGLKGIVRFAYTEDMAGSDAPLNIVLQHIDQLKPLIEANKDVIAFVQAGFIGAYGEWHSSSNGLATPANEKTVLLKLLSAVPADIMVQVRTPLQKQTVFNTDVAISQAQGFSGTDIARVGHHNDCFLSSDDDYGTYVNIPVEKQYISNEALYVPVGGETCPPLGGYSSDCAQGRAQMKLLRWTYLNLDYYQPTLSGWRTSGCFDEFLRNLGYRLSLVNAVLPASAAVNGSLKLNINLTNTGYAPIYNKKNTSIILKNKATGAYYETPLTYDIRTCKPATTANPNANIGESVSLSGIPAGDYSLYLRVADQATALKSRIEYAVRFANTDTWVTDNGGMNDLKSSLKIQ
jgi:predicted component of type VI protein secretion system